MLIYCADGNRRDGWHTIYELAVHREWVGNRIGEGLLSAIPGPRQLKTTVDNERAIAFYAQYLQNAGIEQGKKRELVKFTEKGQS